MSYEKLNLNGKVAVVIGGTSGIGKACALGFIEAGVHALVASSRRQGEVDRTADQFEAMGVGTIRRAVDVTSKDSLRQLREAVLQEFGCVDILLNAAGRTKKAPSLEFKEEDWDTVMDCNLKGTFLACQIFGEHMVARGRGKIINIASLGSYVSLSDAAPYCVSKSGVAMLTKCLGVEWARKGVNVNAIAPGYFLTPLSAPMLAIPERRERILGHIPTQRIGELEELKGAAIYLASEASNYVAGEVLAVDGGFLALGI
jgi:NAD(P)-dependent dehydrogenase (short-subunit alcohol dehydrogenase family)